MLKDLDLSLDSEAMLYAAKKHLAFISPITLQKFLLVRVFSDTPRYVHYNKYHNSLEMTEEETKELLSSLKIKKPKEKYHTEHSRCAFTSIAQSTN